MPAGRKPRRRLKSLLAVPGGAIDLKKNPLALGTAVVGKRFMVAGAEALEALRHPRNPLNAVLVIWDKRLMQRGSTPVLTFFMGDTPEEIHHGLIVAENAVKEILNDPAQSLEDGGVEVGSTLKGRGKK